MKRALQILLPVLILGFAGGVTALMILFKKEPPRREFQAPPREVVTRVLQREDYQIVLHSQGTVRARTTSTLIPEVRGRIVAISPDFREGGFFEEGDVLVEIDASDYETELIVAQAAFAQAELEHAEEWARSIQAKRDWERLNPGTPAGPLTLREPQLKQAAAAMASAEARLRTAQVNLDRTRIRAPFAGRVLSKSVDVGQYVSPGNELAQVYAVDYAEVRLPLTATQYSYLDLPAIYRGEDPTLESGPSVELSLAVGDETHRWSGRIVRSEGAVDVRSRQLYVVAQVSNPYGRTVAGRPPLKVGSFVEADITGRVLANVFVVPRSLIRENTYVLLVDIREDGAVLRRRPVHIAWQTDEVAVIDDGLREGDVLCLTQVPLALEEYPVRAISEAEATRQAAAAAEAPSARRGPPAAAGRAGGFLAGVMAAIPADKSLPPDLQSQLDAAVAAMEAGDRSQMRPAMEALRAWAEANGVELPARGGQ